MNKIKLSIAKDFSKTPGGRMIEEGPHSGELFRNNSLYPKYMEAKKEDAILEVNLDGCLGYPSSFLDESFGGLARLITDEDILDRIEFISEDQPSLINDIRKYVANNRK